MPPQKRNRAHLVEYIMNYVYSEESRLALIRLLPRRMTAADVESAFLALESYSQETRVARLKALFGRRAA